MTYRESAAGACQATAVLLVILIPAVSWAQGTVTTLPEIARFVKQGEMLEVTTVGGRIRGTFESVSPTILTVRQQERDFQYPVASVKKVRRLDSHTNGMLIGLAAGIAGGFIIALSLPPPAVGCRVPGPSSITNQLEGCGDDRASAFSTSTTVGLVAGATIDALMTKTLYVSPSAATEVALSPVLHAQRRSLGVVVRF